MIDVYLTALLSDWLTRQEENSSCKFGALQVIKVGRAGVYYKTGNEKRPTFRKSRCSTALPSPSCSHLPVGIFTKFLCHLQYLFIYLQGSQLAQKC